MIHATKLLRQGLLAIALAATAVGAWAAPTSFHVTLDTATLTADAKYIDFSFLRANGAAAATATVTNLTGAFGTVFDTAGQSTVNADGSLTIGNGAPFDLNYVDFNALFGGVFGFDVSFDGGFLSDPSNDLSTFAVSVLDAGFAQVGGTDALALFNLGRLNGAVPDPFGAFVTIDAIAPNAVPEPSSMLMMMTGLGLVGVVARRRKPVTTTAAMA